MKDHYSPPGLQRRQQPDSQLKLARKGNQPFEWLVDNRYLPLVVVFGFVVGGK
jgi:hypothetical protein